jgi:site-specific recombinase
MIVPSQLALKTHTNLGCAASLATLDKLVNYLRYKSHSCYEACGTFNYITNAYCDGTIIYNDPVYQIKISSPFISIKIDNVSNPSMIKFSLFSGVSGLE